MAEYRIYALDRGGHISTPPKVIYHDTDEQAIMQTQQLFDGQECELWCGERRILHLPIGAVPCDSARQDQEPQHSRSNARPT